MTSTRGFSSDGCSQYGLTYAALARNNEERKWVLKIAMQLDALSDLFARS